ncbi:MAG: glycosyltransferase, partial [Weissella cibaria]
MRNNRQPVLSLIIAAYNVQDEIAATLQSVLTQRRQELEIIIIDDAS